MVDQHKVGNNVYIYLQHANPVGWYYGRVTKVYPNYLGSDDTWIEVHGDAPAPFHTTCRDKSAIPKVLYK